MASLSSFSAEKKLTYIGKYRIIIPKQRRQLTNFLSILMFHLIYTNINGMAGTIFDVLVTIFDCI